MPFGKVGGYDWWLLGGSMAALLVSHLLSFVIAVIFLLLLLLVSLPRLVKTPRMVGHWQLAGVFGVGLGAAFLLPLVEQFMVQTYKNTALDSAGRPLILGSPINIVSAITPWIAQVQGATGSFLLLAGAMAVVSAIVGWPSRPSGFVWTLIIVAIPIGLLVYSPAFVAAIYHVIPGIAVFQASWRFNTVLIPLLTVIIADWAARGRAALAAVGADWFEPAGVLPGLSEYAVFRPYSHCERAVGGLFHQYGGISAGSVQQALCAVDDTGWHSARRAGRHVDKCRC